MLVQILLCLLRIDRPCSIVSPGRRGRGILTAIIGWIVIGVIADWLAGLVLGGSGFGVLSDMVIGLVGAFIGGFLVRTLLGNANGANSGFIWSLLVSFVGAVLLLLIVRAVSGGSRLRT